MFFYKLGDTELEYAQEEKDLGVIVSSNFMWDRQVDALLSKASSRLGLLKRTIHFIRCQKQKRAFYLAIVRSQFEQCAQVWRPSSETQISKLERIQRRAVKWILSEEDHSYNDIEYLMRLRDLDLFPLRERFIISDLILFFDILRGQSCLELPSYIKHLSLEERSRLRPKIIPPQNINSVENSQHLNRLRQSRNDSQPLKSEINAKSNSFKASFFYRTLQNWNCLPSEVKEITSKNLFKEKLVEHFKKETFRCLIPCSDTMNDSQSAT